jgi:hypothetical protein
MIDPYFIEECFLVNEPNFLIGNNINVFFENPLELYGGLVLLRGPLGKEKLELYLPENK